MGRWVGGGEREREREREHSAYSNTISWSRKDEERGREKERGVSMLGIGMIGKE